MLNAYLARAKAAQHSSRRWVVGNEACDLDSVVAAIIYARHISAPDAPAVPVLAIPEGDLPLRTDVHMLMHTLGLDVNNLVFVDALARPDGNDGLEVTLVDHNRLSIATQWMAPHVRRVIDHHDNELLFGPDIATVEPAGSCTSLVVREILKTSGLWGEEAHLALSAILVDTLNLDATSGRTRAVDTEMVHALLHQFPALNRDTLFTDANEARFNVHHLSLPQLLRKDYKQVKVSPQYSVGVSAAEMGLEAISHKGALHDVACEFAADRALDVFCFMTKEVTPTFRRQLYIQAKDPAVLASVVASMEPLLDLHPITELWTEHARAYNQVYLVPKHAVDPPVPPFGVRFPPTIGVARVLSC